MWMKQTNNTKKKKHANHANEQIARSNFMSRGISHKPPPIQFNGCAKLLHYGFFFSRHQSCLWPAISKQRKSSA